MSPPSPPTVSFVDTVTWFAALETLSSNTVKASSTADGTSSVELTVIDTVAIAVSPSASVIV